MVGGPWPRDWTRVKSHTVEKRPRSILLFHTRAFLSLRVADGHSSLQSSHTAAIGRREPFNCLPRSLGVHEGHSLIAGGTTAGVTTDLLVRDAPIVHQCLEGQVIVLSGAVACANTVFKEDYLVWVVAESEIPYPHLLPLQVAVVTALGLLAVPPWCSGRSWVTRGTPPSAVLVFALWPLFYKKKEKQM